MDFPWISYGFPMTSEPNNPPDRRHPVGRSHAAQHGGVGEDPVHRVAQALQDLRQRPAGTFRPRKPRHRGVDADMWIRCVVYKCSPYVSDYPITI